MGWNFGIELERRFERYHSTDEMYACFRVLWINFIKTADSLFSL